MKFAIAPFAAKLPTGERNPKDFPYFAELVQMLNTDGHEIVQIGTRGESRIEGVSQFIQGFPLDKLVDVIRGCDSFVSVDSFLPHLCWLHRLPPGVVIWGQSDPRVWGHPQNANLTKGKLRQFQFAPWYEATYDESVFVSPQEVRDALYQLVQFTPA